MNSDVVVPVGVRRRITIRAGGYELRVSVRIRIRGVRVS
jgi:hypothetical protein